MTDTQWYYADPQQQRHGPLSTGQLQQLHAQGQVEAGTLVWRQGLEQWQPLHSIAELRAARAPDPTHDPYAAPASSVGAPVPAPLNETMQAYAAFVGPRFPVYRRKWNLDQNPNPDSVSTWNWAAFLFGALWMLYRRMYAVAALWLGAMLVISSIELLIGVSGSISAIISIAIAVAAGVVGNHLYLRHATRQIGAASAAHRGQGPDLQAELAARGGTSWLAVVVGVALFVAVNLATALLLDA
ncbi:GYF domain-containing protein [Stenotrophomonas rhizophila]|uniref:GYF domain-containing protein n=1 Tax=Stenotrophomonas rhizophila TaxID=216778 RepID=UPI001E599314|nr:GYF domain-containing protein [Stenotrophomonas rhizophila]MCC7633384.1 DUF4339 domain-containing protein [Stenotrophomonas rhizophila]MCC7662275.1 DUF4339 domain-containing protein [Stenotrophomonas rhizophila]